MFLEFQNFSASKLGFIVIQPSLLPQIQRRLIINLLALAKLDRLSLKGQHLPHHFTHLWLCLEGKTYLVLHKRSANFTNHLFPHRPYELLDEPRLVEMSFADKRNGVGARLPHGAWTRYTHGPE